MKKHEIAKRIKEELELPNMEIGNTVLDTVVEIIKEGIMKAVESDKDSEFVFPGLGKFKMKMSTERTMKSGLTKEDILIPARIQLRFQPMYALKQEVAKLGEKWQGKKEVKKEKKTKAKAKAKKK